jgi:hypothetical protein
MDGLDLETQKEWAKKSSKWRDFWRPGGSKPKMRGIFLKKLYLIDLGVGVLS